MILLWKPDHCLCYTSGRCAGRLTVFIQCLCIQGWPRVHCPVHLGYTCLWTKVTVTKPVGTNTSSLSGSRSPNLFGIRESISLVIWLNYNQHQGSIWTVRKSICSHPQSGKVLPVSVITWSNWRSCGTFVWSWATDSLLKKKLAGLWSCTSLIPTLWRQRLFKQWAGRNCSSPRPSFWKKRKIKAWTSQRGNLSPGIYKPLCRRHSNLKL